MPPTFFKFILRRFSTSSSNVVATKNKKGGNLVPQYSRPFIRSLEVSNSISGPAASVHEAISTEVEPSGRGLLQNATSVLDVLFSVAEAIPVLGTPLKGALESLFKILKLVEQRFQNTEDIDELSDKLASLLSHLTRSPASDYLMRLICQLNKTGNELRRLLSGQGVRYGIIAASIGRCAARIDSYLLEFTALSQLDIRQRMIDLPHKVASFTLQRETALSSETVTVIDPFGAMQKFYKLDMIDLVAIGQLLLNRYSFNPAMRNLLEGFISNKLYEVTLDDGQGVIHVDSKRITTLEVGTSVVVSVIMFEEKDRMTVKCPLCKRNVAWGMRRQLCPGCDRRVQTVAADEEETQVARENAHKTTEVSSLLRQISIKLFDPPNGQEEDEEPRYCYCNGVSYGDMIACDEPTCQTEWFHLRCTDLATLPEGEWYCGDCKTRRGVP